MYTITSLVTRMYMCIFLVVSLRLYDIASSSRLLLFSFFLLVSLPYSFLFFFFFNDTATTEIYTLSLHDALPICRSAATRTGSHSHGSTSRRRNGRRSRRLQRWTRRCPRCSCGSGASPVAQSARPARRGATSVQSANQPPASRPRPSAQRGTRTA